MNVQTILGDKGTEVATIAADATVADAVRLLGERRIGALPVVEGDKVAGNHVRTRRDLLPAGPRRRSARLADQQGDERSGGDGGPVHEVLNALALITQRRIRHLPVVSGGQLVGIVSIGDLVKHRIERIEHEAAAMREYIQSA